MDERIEKAFQTANYMASLSNLRKVAIEELNQSLIYYFQGSSFTITRELITFVNTLISANQQEAIVLDDNNIPCDIKNLEEFFTKILSIYSEATNNYLIRYSEIKTKRRVEGLLDL